MEKIIHKTLSELKQLADTDTFDKENALEVCIAVNQVPAAEMLEFWVQEILKVHGRSIGDFTLEFWTKLTKFFKDIFMKMISDLNDLKQIVSELRPWLCSLHDFVKYVQSIFADLNLSTTAVLMEFSLHTINGYLSFHNSWCINLGLDDSLLQKTLIVYNLVLQLLTTRTASLCVDSFIDFSHTSNLLTEICKVAEHKELIDIKTILKSWSLVTRLSTTCVKWESQQKTQNVGASAKRPLQYLLNTINRNITTIYKRDALEQPIEQVEKYLRVTNFYLKLVERMTVDFKEISFPVTEEFFETFTTSKRMPKYIRDDKIAEIVSNLVINSLKSIMLVIYKNTAITQLLVRLMKQEPKPHQHPKVLPLFDLICGYLEATVADRDIEFIACNANIYTPIFEYTLKEVKVFLNSSAYNTIVEYYAAIAILSPIMRNYFKENVLSAHLSIAVTSTDILLIAASCLQGRLKPTQLLHEFRFWRKCNESFALFSHNPRQCLIQRLLQHFFTLCKSCGKITSKEIWDQYGPMQIQRSNYRFFIAIGIENACSGENVLPAQCTRLSDELFELLNKCAFGCGVANFYKMILFVVLLRTSAKPPKKELFAKMHTLVMRLVKQTNMQLSQLSLLFCAVFALSAGHINNMDTTALHSILEIACTLLNHKRQGNVITIAIIAFLSQCSKSASAEVRQIMQVMLGKVKCCDFVRLLMQTDESNSHINEFGENVAIYQRIYYYTNMQHTCSVRKETETNPTKRQRLDDNMDCNVKLIINDVLKKSLKIVDLCNNIDADDLFTLNCIVTNIKHIISKQKDN